MLSKAQPDKRTAADLPWCRSSDFNTAIPWINTPRLDLHRRLTISPDPKSREAWHPLLYCPNGRQ